LVSRLDAVIVEREVGASRHHCARMSSLSVAGRGATPLSLRRDAFAF